MPHLLRWLPNGERHSLNQCESVCKRFLFHHISCSGLKTTDSRLEIRNNLTTLHLPRGCLTSSGVVCRMRNCFSLRKRIVSTIRIYSKNKPSVCWQIPSQRRLSRILRDNGWGSANSRRTKSLQTPHCTRTSMRSCDWTCGRRQNFSSEQSFTKTGLFMNCSMGVIPS